MVESRDGHRARLRKRYALYGIETLLDYEQLELLLTFVIPRKDCKDFAKKLLKKYGTVANILSQDRKELTSNDGIGDSSALFLSFLKDFMSVAIKSEVKRRKAISSTEDLLDFLKQDMSFLKKEQFKVVFLDTQHGFIKEEVLFEGTIDKSHIYPREIVSKILEYDAKSIIFAHNHPSGVLTPSKEDIAITKKMYELLKNIEVNLLDHVIVSKYGYYSFLEEGRI